MGGLLDVMEEAVLELTRDAIADALSGLSNVEVTISEPARPLSRDDDQKLRVWVEDGGSADRLDGPDGAPGYDAELLVEMRTFRPATIARQARQAIDAKMRGFRIRQTGRHSTRWTSTGWDVTDDRGLRIAGCAYSSIVYSSARILERLGITP